MNKICTDIPQSKRLIELGLDAKTADMIYTNFYGKVSQSLPMSKEVYDILKYPIDGGYLYLNRVGYINSEKPNEDFYAVAPTHQMAMAWLREKKSIFIVIEPHTYDYVNEKNKSYVCSLWIGDNYHENPLKKDFPSYGETVGAALKYCLTEII